MSTDVPAAAYSQERPAPDEMTHWDVVNLGQWGRYITEMEKAEILRAHDFAAPPSDAIDLGCGSGRWSKLLSGLGWRMTCIDVSERTLSICHRILPEANMVRADPHAQSIPCRSDAASLLLCVEVGEVLESDWFLPEAGRVLRKNGVLAAVVWNRYSWRGLACRLKYRMTANAHDRRCYYNFPWRRWRKKLAAAGFEVLSARGLCWGPFTRLSGSSLIPAWLFLERRLRLNRWVSASPWVVMAARKTGS